MPGVLFNVAAVLLGGMLGLAFGRFLSEKLSQAAMTGIGLCTLYIGLSGALGMKGNILITIAALVVGSITGTLLDIDGFINRLGNKAQALAQRAGGKNARVAEGFVAASLLFCVGAMAVTGSLDAGLRADYATLYAKSALDFVAAIFLASALGPGVLLSALAVLVYQGLIALGAGLIAPLLTPQAIVEMTIAGSLVIAALGLNLLHITKIKIADLLPAIFFAPVFALLADML